MTAQDNLREKPHSVVERLTHTFSDWLRKTFVISVI